MNHYVSDIIEKKYTEWDSQTNVFLSADTGTGKTTFLIEELSMFAAKNNLHILYLCNRTALKKDVNKTIEKAEDAELSIALFDHIRVETYQYLESLCIHGNSLNEEYDYIFCDEAHYFMVDSDFNSHTFASLEYILKYPCCKIWATATGQTFFPFLKKKIHKKFPEQTVISNLKPLEQAYDHVSSVCFYNTHEERNAVIFNLLKDDPEAHVLVFVSKKPDFNKLREFFGEDFEVVVSKNAINSYSPEERELIRHSWFNLEENGMQEKSVMFATSALDNGFNIKDPNLKAVFCEMTSPETIIQCLGRKRDASDETVKDSCIFYLKVQPYKKLDIQLNSLISVKDKLLAWSETGSASFVPDRYNVTDILLMEDLSSDLKGYLIPGMRMTDTGPVFVCRLNEVKYERLVEAIDYLTQMKEDGFAYYITGKWFNSYLKKKVNRRSIKLTRVSANDEKKVLQVLKDELLDVYVGSVATYKEPSIEFVRKILMGNLGCSYYLPNGTRYKMAKIGFTSINNLLKFLCTKHKVSLIQFKKYPNYCREENPKEAKKVGINNKSAGIYYKLEESID